MKVYITKYWQTKGVFQVDAELFDDTPSMCKYSDNSYWQYAHGKNWHKTIEAAQADFESRRHKKVMAMRAKMNKLASMKFEVFIK